MFPSVKLSVNRTNQQILREFGRYISKTSSVQQDNKLIANREIEGANRGLKWVKPGRHSNIRDLCTIKLNVKPSVVKTPLISISEEERKDFLATFPVLARDLTDAGRHTDIPEVNKRFTKLLYYTVPTGKITRGLSTVAAYKILQKPKNLTPENIKLANTLGWCMELLHAYFVVSDDIIDNSDSRRGSPCWHKLEDVGLQAVNDGILLENSLYEILKKYFSSRDCYVPIIEIFHDMTLTTSMGQSYDGLCKEDGKPRLDVFNMNRCLDIAKYKAACYSFSLPVELAMYFADIYDEEQHLQAKSILGDIGELYQIQNDFIDCYGDPDVTGKVGTDIEEGKCSWLAVVALQKANPTQRKIMEEHYGRSDKKSIQAVKKLYNDLSLPATYAAFEKKRFDEIKTDIEQISNGLLREVFFRVMRNLYKRTF